MSHPLTRKDLQSDQEVRWCPGCGDYAILSAIQKTMPELEIARENMVFISGIGCSSRFPYYMNTYGFHTIHGRAPAIASGLRLANPDLSVWVITGDGDSLSIGGNHLIHAIRRNININILLFNNQIYGLTKGQYSPTSHAGTVSKSTPYGSVDRPFHPVDVALGAGATFVARTYDKDQKHMTEVFKAAYEHNGTSFVEIFQNCIIFNDGVFDTTIARENRSENILFLKEGEPLTYGLDASKGLRLNGLSLESVAVDESNRDTLVRHTPSSANPLYAQLLAGLRHPDFPEPMGILRSIEAPVYEDDVYAQEASVLKQKGKGDLKELLHSGDVWEIS